MYEYSISKGNFFKKKNENFFFASQKSIKDQTNYSNLILWVILIKLTDTNLFQLEKGEKKSIDRAILMITPVRDTNTRDGK